MRLSALLVGVAAFVAFAGPTEVSPAFADDGATCFQMGGDVAIAACTRVIQSPATSASNRAVAYNNRGIAYCADKGEYDQAIADDNEAIRLDPKDAYAYSNRGAAYENKGQHDQAIADYNHAIELNPEDEYAYRDRGLVYENKGQYDEAIADENQAIHVSPKDAEAYVYRGISYLYSGNLANALADESQASALNPKSAYVALWLDIVGQRNNVPSSLSQAISQIDMTASPAPVIRMFQGQLTPAAALAAADDPDANKKAGQVCESNFYSGELALRTGGKDEAIRLFRLASSGCPKTFSEYDAANAELQALGAAP